MVASDVITQDAEGTPLRWRSPWGVMHAVERLRIGAADSFRIRTRCGTDVAAEETWVGRDTLSCSRCFGIEHEDRLRQDHGHHHGP